MEGIYICLRSIFCSAKGSPEAFWFRSFWNILALWPLDLNSRSCNLTHGWCMVSDVVCRGGGAGRSKKYAKILAGCFWRYSTSPRGSFRAYGGVGMPRSLWDLTWWRGFVSVGLSCWCNLIYFGEKDGRVPGQQPESVGKPNYTWRWTLNRLEWSPLLTQPFRVAALAAFNCSLNTYQYQQISDTRFCRPSNASLTCEQLYQSRCMYLQRLLTGN